MTHQYMEIKIKELEKRIEALEQEPCNDAISRQAVLNYIGRIYNQGTGKQKSFEFIQKFVEKLQPVKPQPKTGHWDNVSICGFRCSECGNEYYRWSYNKRTTCYCSDCYNKRQREQAKAWQKRKLQEYADKVLEDIKAEIERGSKLLCVGSFEKGIAKGLKVALEIIDKHIGDTE